MTLTWARGEWHQGNKFQDKRNNSIEVEAINIMTIEITGMIGTKVKGSMITIGTKATDVITIRGQTNITEGCYE